MLLDGAGPEIIERDDGFVSVSRLNYFAPEFVPSRSICANASAMSRTYTRMQASPSASSLAWASVRE